MDLKMPDISHEIWPAEQTLLGISADHGSNSNQESPQEIQEREELAAELEAMMDAAEEAEAAEKEACNWTSDIEMDMDIDHTEETNSRNDPQEQHEHEQVQPKPKPTHVSASIAPPLLSAAPLMSNPVPRYPYHNRSIRVPISPAQKIIAQQFLRKSRNHLRETSAGGHSRPGDEENEAAKPKIQIGTARDIPEPATIPPIQSSNNYRQNVRQTRDTSQMIPAPAEDPGMHLNEMWRNLDRPSTVDERRKYYGNSQRRKRMQQKSSSKPQLEDE